MDPDTRTCIVTGAGRGIGRAIAIRLAHAGFQVIAAARHEANLAETAALCPPDRCLPCPADVTRPPDAAALVNRCLREFHRLDVLINNAGAAPVLSIEQMDLDAFHALMTVNTHAIFYLCKAAWPALRESRGTIINISSLAAFDPFPGFTVYGATKAWVNAFSRGLADEGRPLGIKVFSLGPGAVETPLLRSAFPEVPSDECLQPDDVAAMAQLLLDPRSQYATGQTIYMRK